MSPIVETEYAKFAAKYGFAKDSKVPGAEICFTVKDISNDEAVKFVNDGNKMGDAIKVVVDSNKVCIGSLSPMG